MEKKSNLDKKVEPGSSKKKSTSDNALHPTTSSSSSSSTSASDNLIISNYRAMKKALETPVILDEIFKQLSVKDRKSFREVNRLWWHETVAIWRRDAWMKLFDKAYLVSGNNKLKTMESFYEVFSKLDPDDAGEWKWKEEKYGLLKHPFRRFHINYNYLCPFTEEDPESTRFFWGFYGTHLTHLWINSFQFRGTENSLFNFAREILLRKCPNLVEFSLRLQLSLNSKMRSGRDADQGQVLLRDGGQVAEKLKSLTIHIHGSSVDFHREILKLVPNIDKVDFLEADVLDILAAEQIQIHTCSIPFYKTMEHTHPILNYAKTFPTALKELTFCAYTSSSDYIDSPLNKAFRYCKSLSVLRLKLDLKFWNWSKTWLDDLRGVSLPNLKELSITFGDSGGVRHPRFDFLTLKGLPKLEVLKVFYIDLDWAVLTRHPGTADWIGDPPVIEVEPWTGSENLRKLTFDGWSLNREDVIGFFRAYFPNLEYFKAALNRETLPLVCTSWENSMKKVANTDRGKQFSEELLQAYKAQYEKIEFIQPRPRNY